MAEEETGEGVTDRPVISTAACAEIASPTVYGLVDPNEPGRIRYVGQTPYPLLRYHQHLRDAISPHPLRRPSRRERWIGSLLGENRTPLMVLLERCPSRSDLLASERRWVGVVRVEGGADLNVKREPRG